MKFVCERCQTRYSIADDKVRQKVLKIRCKACENVIILRDPASAPESGAARASAPVVPPPASAPSPGPQGADWFVAINGRQVGPLPRVEAARRIVAAKADDEIFVWREDFDAWKAAHDVPAIADEVKAQRGLMPVQPRPVPPALPSKPAPPGQRTPGRATLPPPSRSPGAAVRGAAVKGPPRSTPAEGLGAAIPDSERTQVQPVDLAVMMADIPRAQPPPSKADKGTNGRPHAALGAQPGGQSAHEHQPGRQSGGEPGRQSGGIDGLFKDFGASSPGGFFPDQQSPAAPPPGAVFAPTGVVAESGLSQIRGLPGFFSRHPAIKFTVSGAVMVLLLGGLAVVVLLPKPGRQQLAAAGVVVAEEGDLEERARREAEQRFRSEVGALRPRAARVEPRRPARPAAKPEPQPTPTAAKPAPAPAPPTVEPAPIQDPGAPLPGGERRVKTYAPQPTLARAAGPASGPVVGQVSEAMISEVVKKRVNQEAIKSCYERALRRDDRLRSGRIDVTASVGLSGAVKTVVVSAPPEFSSVEPCIRSSVKRWAFPSTQEEYSINFPLILQGNL